MGRNLLTRHEEYFDGDAAAFEAAKSADVIEQVIEVAEVEPKVVAEVAAVEVAPDEAATDSAA